MPMTSNIALVVDALPGLGGAEKVLMAALELFPNAPIYTLLYNQAAFACTPLASRRVICSFIERLPLAHTQYRNYLPLMPFAMRLFDMSAYDTVLSFSYAVAHGVKVADGKRLLSYTYTPMRYAWSNLGLDGKPRRPSPLLDWAFSRFRAWDVAAASRVAGFAAVSQAISDWIRRAYRRESRVIYPPVEIERFSPAEDRGNYFVTIARLVPHKRIDLLVEAFNRTRLPLMIVGDGPERPSLERRAAANIHFLGFQPDPVIVALLSRARAYVCPGEEDFGIAMVEAQASGCPVIAFGEGGAREIVSENRTGKLFADPSPESLADAVESFNPRCYASRDCVLNARRFDKNQFLRELGDFVMRSSGT